MNKLLPPLLFLATLLTALACSHNNDEMPDADRKALLDIDSLLGIHAGNVRPLISKGLAHAKDSMAYEEYRGRLAKYYSLSSTPDSLLPVVEEVERFARLHLDSERGRQLLAFAYNCHAGYYHNFHLHSDQTIFMFNEAYNLLMASENKSQAPMVAANMADAYAFTNDLPKAAQWYRRALFLTDSLALPRKNSITLYLGLAGIYQQLGDNANALHYYKQTEHYRKDMTVGMQAYFLNNYGNYYYYLHNYDAALKKFEELRRFLESHGMSKNFDMFLCKVNLADVYLNLGQLDKAEQSLNEVETFLRQQHDPAIQYYCNTIRIGIAVKRHNYASVAMLAGKDRNTSVSFQMRQIRARYMRQYYEERGDYETAYQDVIAYLAYNDSLQHNVTNMRTADIMARFAQDTLRLHANAAIEHQHAAMMKSRTVMIIAVAVALILLLMLLVWRYRSKKQLADARMKVMDLKLSSARNRISPHFVFNVLNNQIIASGEEGNGKDQGLLNLTKLIRENLDLSLQSKVPLTKELDFIKRYVNIEQSVIGEDFDFQIIKAEDIDTDDVEVPSMLIQIMTENAVVHGLSGWKGHKKLTIDISHQGQNIVVSVTDNGPGFLPQSLNKKSRNGLNIIRQTLAVANSRSRHKLIYAMHNVEQDGKVAGCRASLTIPYPPHTRKRRNN